jgi:isopentenyl-diphosphate delta-isomerase
MCTQDAFGYTNSNCTSGGEFQALSNQKETDIRQQRKLDHLRLGAIQWESRNRQCEKRLDSCWDDLCLVHNSLPELSFDDICISSSIQNIALRVPVIVNSMTGGVPATEKINRDLADIAASLGAAMAVGSQTLGLDDSSLERTYRIARLRNPDGVIIANINAFATIHQANAAIDMVEADLLQIHLNAPQEVIMKEGARNFRGQLKRIEEIVLHSPVPVIVKECGFGLSRESVKRLYDVGVRAIDVSGRGGTNFARIEAERQGITLDPGLEHWGISSCSALIEAVTLDLPDLEIIASGGIVHGSEAAKALALGAAAVGVAGSVLNRYRVGGHREAYQYMKDLITDIKRVLLLCGARTLDGLRKLPVLVFGRTRDWCHLRGISVEQFAEYR